MQIAAAALRQAQDNYNTKYNQAIADASKDATLDIKQYRCQMMPVMGGMTPDNVTVNTDLAPTYAISYEVSSGLDNALLAASGHSARYSGDTAVLDNTAGASQFGEIVNAFTGLGSNKVKVAVVKCGQHLIVTPVFVVFVHRQSRAVASLLIQKVSWGLVPRTN